MKKYIIIICVLMLSIFISEPVFAVCTEETGSINLVSNNILEDYTVRSYAGLGGTGNYVSQYGVSTFNVHFNSRPASSYYGYCIDPGYRYSVGLQSVCCSAVPSSRYTRGVKDGFIYLSKIAGNALSRHDEDQIIISDLAIRFYAMANNLSNSISTSVGEAFYHLTNYLQLVSSLYKQGRTIYGEEHKAEINAYVDRRLRETKYAGYKVDSFLHGPNSERYISAAYLLFQNAMEEKNKSSAIGGGRTELDIQFDGTEENVSCDNRNITLKFNKGSSVENLRFVINDDESISANINGDQLVINAEGLFARAQCNSGAITISIKAFYTGGSDENVYICTASSGGKQQQILTYVGEEGLTANSNNTRSYTYILTMPSSCIPQEWANRCVLSGQSNGRCLPSGTVEIKSSLNNCCVDPDDANTSTVSDELSYGSVDDELDLDELFVKDPGLRRNDLMSIVKCGSQALTSAPDFNTSNTTDADATIMKEFCGMYCMERTRILTPPPVDVTAGRYFELDFRKFDIREERKCRISVDLPKFFETYVNVVREEIHGINTYYYNQAHYLLYRTVWDNDYYGKHRWWQTDQIVINCKRVAGGAACPTSSGEGYNAVGAGGLNCTDGVQEGGYLTRFCSITYDRLDTGSVQNENYPYITAYLNDDVGSRIGRYAYNQPNTFIAGKVSHGKESIAKYRKPPTRGFFAYEYRNGCQGDPYELAGSPNCTCPDGGGVPACVTYYTWEHVCPNDGTMNDNWNYCTRKKKWHQVCNSFSTAAGNAFECQIDAEGQKLLKYIMGPGYYPNFDIHMREYAGMASGGRTTYLAALSRLKSLEASFRECLHFFGSNYYGGSNLENHYDVSMIDTSFEYDQVYTSANGGMTTATIYGTIDHTCTVKLEDVKKEYDPGFGSSGDIKLNGFHNDNLPYRVGTYGTWGFNGMNLEGYLQSFTVLPSKYSDLFYKYVTLEGTYRVYCDFSQNNEFYTLIPGGFSATAPTSDNYVLHQKLLTTFLTTYAGKHEILYHVSGTGSQIQRQFDTYFQRGNTCSGRNSGAVAAPASCYFNVTQKMVTTGVCEGYASSINYKDVCYVSCALDGTCSGIYNFMFKIADPTNLFPNGFNSSDGTSWGLNWRTVNGENTRREIELDGEKDTTYAPNNLMYSFTLSTKTIEAIKRYNAERLEYGGYSDFGLSCDCGTNGENACIHCKSDFLTNLAQANGIFTGLSSYISDTPIWQGNENIQIVRDRNHKWDKDNQAAQPVLY